MNDPVPPAEPGGVLVVDDNDDIRPILCAYVSALGYRAYPASSGAEAVEVLNRHAGEVGVALVDLHMPGLGGWGTVAALKRLKPGLPCCLVSGDYVPQESIQAAGVHSVLEKPFRAEALARCLRDVRV
jgi:CheY-like chemotaxis protein